MGARATIIHRSFFGGIGARLAAIFLSLGNRATTLRMSAAILNIYGHEILHSWLMVVGDWLLIRGLGQRLVMANNFADYFDAGAGRNV
jgi:hypothetical protein